MSGPLDKLAFLVVDDNANMAHIVKAILKGLGVIHVHEATNVAEAFEVVRQFSIDIVILDFNLGFMDGVDFVKLIRTAPDTVNAYLPVIMLTAHTEGHRVAAARDAGVTEFCSKPVVPLDLYRKIVSVIERPRTFVRAGAFFGPDRRRRRDGEVAEERRAQRGPSQEI